MALAQQHPRWTEYVDVDDLVPDERNPKNHADDLLDDSLERFGYTEQVMIDDRTGKLCAGHGRRTLVLRARERGGEPPPGIVVQDGRWLVPVQRGWSSSNDDEAYAYLVASNRLTEKGGWYEELLAQGLTALGTDLTGVGFTAEELEDLVQSLAPPPSLDDLAEQYGDPVEEDMWPVLRFKVSPAARARYLLLVRGVEGSDADLFDHLLNLADKGAAV